MTFLERHFPELSLLPVMLSPVYPHRLHKNYYYSDAVRETLHEKRCSWVVERIFVLQLDERVGFKGDIQHWSVKNMPDGTLMVACADEKGRVVYYEHGYSDQPRGEDLSFVLYHNILHIKN